MRDVINGKIYDTDSAILLLSDRYWDGNNWERNGRNTFLYVTGKGNFFSHHTTIWQGEREKIVPLNMEDMDDQSQLEEYFYNLSEVEIQGKDKEDLHEEYFKKILGPLEEA